MVFKKQLRKSRLAFGEGLEDKALLKHFLRVFKIDKREDIYVHTGCGTGGSPKDIINAAAREIGNFGKKLVILDRDDKTDDELKKIMDYAHKKQVDCHIVTPCLEAIILHIIEPNTEWRKHSAQECKHEVETKHITRKKRTDEYAYKKLTPEKITEACKTNNELKLLIDYITKP